MGKVTGGKSAAGGSSKGSSSERLVVIKKETALQTEADKLLVLRQAMRDEMGEDKDVLKEFSRMTSFNKNGLEASLQFYSAGSLPREMRKTAFKLSKTNLKQLYDDSGYGWDDDEKRNEQREEESRFIVAACPEGKMVGFVHFKFSLEGEVIDTIEGNPALLVFDLQIVKESQRKGLGKFMMTIVELIARKQKMQALMVPLVKGNPAVIQLLSKPLRFSVDATYGEDDVQAIYSKSLVRKPVPKKATPKPAAKSTPATAPAIPEDKTGATAAATATTTKDSDAGVDEAAESVKGLEVDEKVVA